MNRQEELEREFEARKEIKRVKRHPAYWWDYFLLWLLSRGVISIKVANRFRWVIGKK